MAKAGEDLSGLTKKLKDFVKSRGATLVGIARAERLSKAPEGHRPENLLPDAKSLISIGVRMNRSSILRLPKTMKQYKIGYDVANSKLNSLAWETADFLENEGYAAMSIPASAPYDEKNLFGDISHKHVAVASGLGTFGLNNLVLTPNYGAYVRFVTVITTAPLDPDKPLETDLCLGERCLKCVRACPAKALDNPVYNSFEGWRIDKEKCHKYIHEISCGDVCGLCIKACIASTMNR